MKPVIKIIDLYKEYKLGVVGRGTLYRDLQSWWSKIRNKEDPNSVIGKVDISTLKNKSFLALQAINLEIFEGEIIGIIGANGAGKSTLLKLLSRITNPSKGIIKIKGKIASLLEVGTGFHTELTGKENILLNGTMNGMSIKEIKSKIKDIIEFAGIEKFADTPVKRYSSGMFVRLGFAVAAFLEPDILIVDEVLSVGDASFQKKAINKIEDVTKEKKRTVLFVSHNMDSIKRLCTKVIILDKGIIIDQGHTKSMIDKYLNKKNDIRKIYKQISWNFDEYGPGGSIVKLKSITSKNINNKIKENFQINEGIIIETDFWVLKDDYQICCLLEFYNKDSLLFQSFDKYIKGEWGKQKGYKKGLYKSVCKLPKNFFNEGVIDINVIIFMPPGSYHDSFQVSYPTKQVGALSFNIVDDESNKNVKGSYPYDLNKGASIRPGIEHLIL